MTTLKNQIKSFTSDSIKKEINNFFVFLGGISGSTYPDSSVDQSDISIISRITSDEISIVCPRKNWKINDVYEPFHFGSNGINSYCYNNLTDIVYLCVGKNKPNCLLGETEFFAKDPPTHSTGIQTYPDGYSWFALYKIDSYLNNFLTETEMPINSLYDFTTDINSGTYLSKYSSLCIDAGKTGNCYFYYNETTKDPITSIVYLKGDQVLGIGAENWQCSTCHSFGESLGYKTIHVDNFSIESKIDRNSLDELVSKINSNSLDINNRFYIHYLNYNYEKNLNKSIINLHLDVSNLSLEDRIVKTQEPSITFIDPLGVGAVATLSTYYDIRRNAFVVNGINLKNGGTNYVNPKFVVPDANSKKLENNIKSVIAFGVEHPSTFLPNTRVSIVKQISNVNLETIGTNQRSFSKVGIITNVLSTNNITPTVGTQSNEAINGRVTTKVVLNPLSSQLPDLSVGEVYLQIPETEVVTLKKQKELASEFDYASKLVAVNEDFDESNNPLSSTLEIAAVDEVSFQEKTTIKIDNNDYSVSSVLEPEFKIDNIEYIVTNKANIVYTNTGSESLTKISFLL